MKCFMKYRFLKYGILLALLDIFSRDTFAIGGGVFVLMWAIFAALVMEKIEKDAKKDSCVSIKKEIDKT